jgi:hypothetical protein
VLGIDCCKQKTRQASAERVLWPPPTTSWTGQTNLALAEFIMRPQAEALQIGAGQMLRETTSGCQMPRKSPALVGKSIAFLALSYPLRRAAQRDGFWLAKR